MGRVRFLAAVLHSAGLLSENAVAGQQTSRKQTSRPADQQKADQQVADQQEADQQTADQQSVKTVRPCIAGGDVVAGSRGPGAPTIGGEELLRGAGALMMARCAGFDFLCELNFQAYRLRLRRQGEDLLRRVAQEQIHGRGLVVV